MTVGTGWDAWVFGELTFPSGALDKWKKPAFRTVGERCRALFVGTDAARTLEHDSGRTPRPEWRAMHRAPWSDPAPLTLQLATPAPAAKKKAAKKPRSSDASD